MLYPLLCASNMFMFPEGIQGLVQKLRSLKAYMTEIFVCLCEITKITLVLLLVLPCTGKNNAKEENDSKATQQGNQGDCFFPKETKTKTKTEKKKNPNTYEQHCFHES